MYSSIEHKTNSSKIFCWIPIIKSSSLFLLNSFYISSKDSMTWKLQKKWTWIWSSKWTPETRNIPLNTWNYIEFNRRRNVMTWRVDSEKGKLYENFQLTMRDINTFHSDRKIVMRLKSFRWIFHPHSSQFIARHNFSFTPVPSLYSISIYIHHAQRKFTTLLLPLSWSD